MPEKNNGPNWKQMKVEYVSTDISMKKLSEKYGVNHNTIQSHAQHEKWTDLRRAARRKANEKLVRQAASKRAKELAKSIDIGYALMAKVQSISADAKDMKSTKRRSETVTEKHLDKLDIDVPVRVVTETDLSELARMYATLMHTLGFDEASQIAHERLELDRLKVEMQVDADMERDERPIIIDERPDAEDEDAEQSEHL